MLDGAVADLVHHLAKGREVLLDGMVDQVVPVGKEEEVSLRVDLEVNTSRACRLFRDQLDHA